MNKCYTLKKINLNEKISETMFSTVNDTFIITMENAYDRHKNIKKQLKKFVPTKNINIVFNKGYLNCNKFFNNQKINKTYLDLTYTYITIFRHALDKNLKNILILEDDFIWSENIEKSDINLIDNFIRNKNPNVYILGCKPFIMNPFNIFNNHINYFTKGDSHSIIYSKNGMIDIINLFTTQNFLKKDIDVFTNSVSKKYIYKKPICFQIHNDSDNKKTWLSDLGLFEKILVFLGIKIESLFNFKEIISIEKNYNLFYNISFFFHKFFLIIISIILIKILKLIINIELVKKKSV